MVSAQLQLALMRAVQVRHRSKSLIVEEALWRELGRLSARSRASLIKRLKYLDALVGEIIADVASMNANEQGIERVNVITEKTRASMNQIFDLAQTEPLTGADQRRAIVYRILARLALVTAALFENAAGSNTLTEIQELHGDQLRFEEVIKELEVEEGECTSSPSPSS